MQPNRRQLEELVVEYSHRVHERGWVANHDGNLTVRLADERFLSTPTSVSKGAVRRESLIVVDAKGHVVSGTGKPFSELALHLFVYRHRPDVRAVLHAHPPTATGFAVAGVEVRTTIMPEPVVSLGRVPLVAYARPKSPEWTGNLAELIDDADALLLEHHGALTVGPDIETAFLRMELVEHLARIQLSAQQAAGVRDIPAADVEALLESRTKAGLGRAARAGNGSTAARPERQAARDANDAPEQVRAIVLEEVGRALTR